MDFSAVGVRPDRMMVPAPWVDKEKWACVACDQYTSQPEYWHEAARIVADAPSCLHMIVPECFLGEAQTRIPQIHRTMEDYCRRGVLQEQECPGMMLIERVTDSGVRHGLVCSVDLEAYDFTGVKSLVRPTEETVAARLPARMAVRQEAPVEASHVMLLIDDAQDAVLGGLRARLGNRPYDYDFTLMQGCGQLRGRWVSDAESLQAVLEALLALKDKQGAEPLLFAVGDGNHSLASARAHWLRVRETLPAEEQACHPARYAMAEIVNIHDPALGFEPIHRVLTHVEEAALLADWAAYAAARGMTLAEGAAEGAQRFTLVSAAGERTFSVLPADGPLPVATLQAFLDDYLHRHPEAEIDYIHGDDVLRRLAGAPGRMGFLLPALDKAAFFPAIDALGTLPRKTFSMGHANEKRCYYECRAIR
ncbi:MAG: DUF1015 domain-containing protein [Clostridia bacterium]|nr:DUF1015 domain-containing protein [Clostridia bacterium]